MDVPELVRQRARSRGSAGERWLADLPGAVASLAAEWDLEVGTAFEGGTASFVVASRTSTGRECVLKIGMPLGDDDVDAFTRSVTAHRLAAGRGCVELLAHDADRSAMLLERLGPNLADVATPLGDLLVTVADTLRDFWRPRSAFVATDDPQLPTAIDQLDRLRDFITTTWGALGRPCDRVVVDRALEYCDRRAAAFDLDRAILVHGDAHGWNTLSAPNGGHKLVDPEGLWSTREHDLGIPMREYNEPLLLGDTGRLVRERAEMLAERCAADVDAVWEWGFIERVSTGLANLRDFDGNAGAGFLEVARRCV